MTTSVTQPPPGPVEGRVAHAQRWWRILREEPSRLVMGLAALLLAFLVLYPMFWLLYGSLTYGEGDLGETLWNFWAIPGLQRAFLDTLWVVAGTLPLAILFALPLAWITGRTDTPLRGLIEMAALVPFITPPVIGAIAWAMLASPRTGLLNVFARELIGAAAPLVNIYSLGGMVFVMAIYMSPYVFITAQAALQQMDATLEDASLIAGAGYLRTLRYVVLPLSLPALLSGGILVFVRTIEVFAIPGILGAPVGIYTITTYIYYRAISYFPPRYGVAAVLAVFVMALSAVGLLLQARLLGGGRRFTTIAGRGRRPRRIHLGRWRYVTLAYALGYLFLAVGLPYLVLIYGVFIEEWGKFPWLGNLTLANVFQTFDASPVIARGLRNSLVLALGGATFASLLTAVVSYLIVKTRWRGRGALDLLSMLPLCMPGAVIAVGLLWAYIRPPLMLYGTLWILGVAYVTRYLPYGVRTVTSSLRQVHEELERAAMVCGASWFRSFWDVLLPLIRPGILAGWMLMFISMMRELSASIFLYTAGTETAAVALYDLWQEGIFSYVSVLALVLVGLSTSVLVVVRRFLGAGPGETY